VLAQLIPLKGGKPITIHKDITVVGRQREDSDICIDHKSISKIHCVIVKTDGLLFVRDLASTNGTKVNDQKISRGALLPGDQLAFASEKFRVHIGPDVPGTPEVSATDRTEMLDVPPMAGIPTQDSDSDVQLMPVD
jgi:pSer/pThr/pTyr-binding forkhead associated (FHA) protein